MSDYWYETIEIALNDEGVEADKGQIWGIASAVEVSAENYGMAHGHDAIPSYADTKKDDEIASLKKEISELQGDIEIFRTSVARRRNVSTNQVYLERWGAGKGSVMVDQS